jgi:proline dehydrogenase
VKGAYQEPAEVAFLRKSETDASYSRLARLLLQEGRDPELATHDQALLEALLASAPAPERFSIAMLYGIRSDLLRSMAQRWRVRSYLPYGPEWYPYIMRRLAERPANLGFVLRNLLRG